MRALVRVRPEPYIWEHLPYHLRGAGDSAGVTALVCDLAYLALRSFRSGPYAAESDLRQAARRYSDCSMMLQTQRFADLD